MAYVSCMYAPPDPTGMTRGPEEQSVNARIICTDDHDPPQTWWLSEDSTVGDWLRFKEQGGEVTPYVAPEEEPPDE